MDDVDRRLLRLQQVGDRLVHRRGRVVVVQRNRALGVRDQRRRPAGAAGEVLAQERDVPERGRHQQELGVRQLQQRNLPGPAAVGVTVEVELVHDHQARLFSSATPPSRSAMLASTSAVQAMIGAPALTEASPVSMPTLAAPNTSHRVKNFSLTKP